MKVPWKLIKGTPCIYQKLVELKKKLFAVKQAEYYATRYHIWTNILHAAISIEWIWLKLNVFNLIRFLIICLTKMICIVTGYVQSNNDYILCSSIYKVFTVTVLVPLYLIWLLWLIIEEQEIWCMFLCFILSFDR